MLRGHTSKKGIYLDYAGATPVDKAVLKEMYKFDGKFFANPSSIHYLGVLAHNLLEESRSKIAKLINAHSDEIIFTSSGTESDALAILGLVYNLSKPGLDEKNIPHIVTTNIEHPAILENCRLLEKRKEAEVTYIEPDENGLINPKDIKNAIKENTVLVSVMYANNEIGTIEPIQEIAKEIRHFRKTKSIPGMDKNSVHTGDGLPLNFPVFHTDACQAINYLDISNIEKLGVDMMSFNSSKIYGPKGVGILFKKRGLEISPVYGGGEQEFGLRSGTENVVNIAGFSKALEVTEKIKNKEVERLTKIRNYAVEKILELKGKTGYEIILNGSLEVRLPNNINISVKGISSELLVIELDAMGIYVSEKSACQSEKSGGSYVIKAIRNAERGKASLSISDDDSGSIRISLGRYTTKKDMNHLVSSFKKILLKYKSFIN